MNMRKNKSADGAFVLSTDCLRTLSHNRIVEKSIHSCIPPGVYVYCEHMKKKNHAQLQAHLSRIEGQLSAVRDALERDDCSKAAKTLLAASRSLQSARALCVTGFLSERVYPHVKAADAALLEDVRSLLKA